jgi:hypothetical protein
MPPRWVTMLLLAWLAIGVGVTLLLRLFHHHSSSP